MRAVLALTFAAAVVPAWAVEYRVIDLGPPGPGNNSEALAVNDAGMVTLMQRTYTDIPFVWTPEQGFARMGPLINWRAGAWPHALNNAGMAAGRLRRYNGRTYPFRWTRSGGFQFLPILPGKVAGEATAVNELGEVAGTCELADTPDRAFYWSLLGGLADIGVLHTDGASRAYGMNDAGVVVGQASFDTGSGISFRAFRWTHDTGIEALPLPQGIEESWGKDVNSFGTVVGKCYDFNFNVYPFRWSAERGPERLAFYGEAVSISDRGEVVGSARRGAFSYTDTGGVVYVGENLDTQSQGWELSEARAVNGQGWIVGRGQFGGKTRAFVAIPH